MSTAKQIVPLSKKGFVYSLYDPTTSSKVNTLNVGWHYNWNFLRTPGVDNSVPYTPMIWGMTSVGNQNAVNIINKIDNDGYENVVLGFNEPDGAKQANMTVEQAIANWPLLLNSGRRVGSPASAGNPTTAGGWLANFMTAAKAANLRVDLICVHWYAPPNATSFLKELDTLYQQYGLPIWITEFAVADWTATTASKFTVDQISAFMKAVIPELNKRSYIERFAWKTRSTSDVNMGTSALFNDDGSLTALGSLYASL
jgi:hypothetical protein